MKLSEIIARLDKSKQNEESIDWDELGSEFGVNLEWQETSKLKAYWMYHTLCTDTWVGGLAYFLDDKFVGVSIQQARKSSLQFLFNKDSYKELQDYVLSLVADDTPEPDFIEDMEEDLSLHTVDFES